MSNKKKNQHNPDFKQDDIVQAVIIADSFNVRFAPLTKRRPRSLLPLVNTTLLDYTLEFVCNAGIEQVFVFCCSHADQIRKHVQSSKWSGSGSTCDVQTIVMDNCLSMGEVLREIDSRSLIKSDFVLVNGDTVSNINLQPIIAQHKERRLKEKTPILTMVMTPAGPGHQTRCREDDVIIAVDTQRQRVLHYQKMAGLQKVQFPLSLFQEHKSVQLRYDLLDSHISVCSPHVLPLFTDNFDYQTRDDFIKGILVNEEILGNTIHVHVTEDEYAARVSNLYMYNVISKDVMNRWTYPIVPDCNITNQSEDSYSYGRHSTYLHKDVSRARGCVLKENVVVGKDTHIGSNSCISHSVIGKNCHIGENVQLTGAHVWDNVRIENGCKVTTSVLGNGVHLLPNTTVQPGCILGEQVKVGADITLAGGTVLMSEPPVDGYGDVMKEYAEVQPELVGNEGVAYEYHAPDDSDDELGDLSQNMLGLNVQSEEEEFSTESEESDSEASMREESPPPDDTKMFYDEMMHTLVRAMQENVARDNQVLEINSLKCAYYMQITEVNIYLTKGLLEFPFRQNEHLESTHYFPKLKLVLTKFLPLLQNYIRSAESQKDCISSIEDTCVGNSTITASLTKILHFLYDKELLSEEVLITWQAHPSHNADNQPERVRLRKQVKPLITWLQEAEEESSEEESD